MSGSSESGKSSIKKFVPEERIELEDYLLSKGIKDIERRVILVNGTRIVQLDQFVEKDDEIIVLPKLKGG
ncbi:MAG: hypothetical protein FK733_09660 [Asgard group archaeon]|nr:hypothetical protein [Asgard group archaeon]